MTRAADSSLAGERAALIVGHPGHELRVLGWMRGCQPAVAVLTDGSGHGQNGRIELTTDLLDAAGCRRSSLYGVHTDKDIYQAILEGEDDFFLRLAGQLADWLLLEEVDVVASDAVEGYNPTHDLCAAVAGRAARLATARSGRAIAHFTFLLTGAPVMREAPENAVAVELSAAALADKLSESRRYAARAGGALVQEVETMIAEFGETSFAREFLQPATLAKDFAVFAQQRPFYETHGEKQVAAGLYRHVIRYQAHVAPIIRALAS